MKQNQVVLAPEIIKDENIYSDVWLDSDDWEEDISRLIEQNRIRSS
jgi:hypothetical protein